ncbi:uncharacterized skeletal organic matrix protein 5-like [Stylophora pistillata]|uniref:uncharacterized skeletal organic matrix protein 5-like n=1 Tax=Stylophora pistillata TaxID=50429 RepID=UPI000C056B6D|nr:uncharacterized skeletal organic matrix protein 5-like [Stylophora pistillata]
MAEADGRYWCELLSSDKYINSEDFNKNMTSRHLFKKVPCATSCKQLYEAKKFNKTQMATLRFGSTPTSVMCHVGDFGCGPGAWTTVLKTDGNKKTFRFDSAYWSNTNEYKLDGGSTGFDTQETKLSTYWNTPFSQICLGMKVSEQLNFVVLNKQASSLFSLIADGSNRSTSLARYTWKTLLGSKGSLQLRWNKQGFNSVCKQCRVRIGIVSNNEYNCESCDSRIGFGASGPPYDSSTCGNEAKWYPDNGNRNIKAMGYVLVQ